MILVGKGRAGMKFSKKKKQHYLGYNIVPALTRGGNNLADLLTHLLFSKRMFNL